MTSQFNHSESKQLKRLRPWLGSTVANAAYGALCAPGNPSQRSTWKSKKLLPKPLPLTVRRRPVDLRDIRPIVNKPGFDVRQFIAFLADIHDTGGVYMSSCQQSNSLPRTRVT